MQSGTKAGKLTFLTFRGGLIHCLLFVQQLLYYATTCGRYKKCCRDVCNGDVKPQEWQAQLNRGVSLLGAGDYEEARKAFREAFKMTNRVELYDAINHLKQMQKCPEGLTLAFASAEQSATGQHDSIAGEIFGWRK